MGPMHPTSRLARTFLALALAVALTAPGKLRQDAQNPSLRPSRRCRASSSPWIRATTAATPSHAAEISKLVWIGNGYKPCNQVGTSTLSGYPEHAFNFDVALRVKASLEYYGAERLFDEDDRHGRRTVRRRPRASSARRSGPTWR